MNAPARFRLLLVPALLALLAAHAPALGDLTKGKTFLVRPDPVFDTNAVVPDANAKGKLNIDTKTSTGRDRLVLSISGVDKALSFMLFVEDPQNAGNFTAPGIPLTGKGSTKTLKLDTDKGDALPYGVTALADLQGVEVRIVTGTDPEDPAALFLHGFMPALGIPKETLKAKQQLALAPGALDLNAKGKVWVTSTASTGDERILLKVSQIDFNSHTFSLWIEDAPSSGTFTKGGDLVKKTFKKGFFERVTKAGAPLPVGEMSAASFAGRKIEVRDQIDTGSSAADHAYLSALVPQLN
jgi:hypothetical protein